MEYLKKYKSFLILIIFAMGSQSLFYYSLKYVISDFNIIDSFIDFPLVKSFVYFYDAWYPFILFNAFLVYLYDRKLFNYLIITMLLAAFFGHVTFIIYPSMVIRPTIVVHNLTDWLVDFTYKSDTPAVNCLPSIHCIYCFVTSYYILKCKNLDYKRIILVVISILTALSTVFIKQHIIEDVILAFIYTVMAILIVKMNEDRIDKLFKKINI